MGQNHLNLEIYRGVLYYAELNYAEKGIKAKLRRIFFSPVQNAEHAKLRRIAKLCRGFNVRGDNAEILNDDFYLHTIIHAPDHHLYIVISKIDLFLNICFHSPRYYRWY